jgi:iron complex outermembrane receptor protein
MLSRAIRVALLFGSAGLAAPLTALPQGAAPAAAAAGPLEEVVVTAQKREQSSLEVPIAITAFSAEQIERAGIQDFEDYATKTPNIGFTQQGSRAYTKVAIRGITNIGGKVNSVGVYLDEFNIAPNILTNGYSRTADTNLFDVEQIEVLRGPQGTYFGRNTMGGAISITSRKPQLGEFAGRAGADVDDRGGWLVRGGVDIPLGESVALGVSGYYQDVAGFLDNKGPSGRIDDGSDLGARVALRAEPTDDLTIDVAYLYSDQEEDARTLVPSGDLATIPATLVDVVNFWPFIWAGAGIPGVPAIDTGQFPEWPLPTTSVPFYPRNHDKIATDDGKGTNSVTDTVIARIEAGLSDNLSLVSVTGYMQNDFDLHADGDMSPYPAFTVGRTSESNAWSEELRLSSFGNETLDWTLGAIYASDEIEETDVSTHLASDPYLDAWGALLFALGVESGQVPITPDILGALQGGVIPAFFGPLTVGNFEDVDRSNETDSFGLFGDLTWHVNDRLDLSAGLRYTDDDVTFEETTRPTITLPVGTDKASGNFSDTLPRFAANFRLTPDVSFYATIAEGYKVGGFNSDVTTDLPAVEKKFDPETGWNYELGIKTILLADRLQLNAAAFYFDWSDLQVRSQDVQSQRQFVQNATDASSQGFELEMVAALGGHVQFRATYGYLDATFGTFKNAVDLDGNSFDASGNVIPYAPGDTISLALDWRQPLDAFEVYARADWSYTGQQYFDAANTRALEIPVFDVLDLRAGVARDSWDVSLWLRNALDEEYVLGVDRLETYYTGNQRAVGVPRTLGASLRYRF